MRRYRKSQYPTCCGLYGVVYGPSFNTFKNFPPDRNGLLFNFLVTNLEGQKVQGKKEGKCKNCERFFIAHLNRGGKNADLFVIEASFSLNEASLLH